MIKNNLLIIVPHLSTGGAPQFTLNKIELLILDYNIICIEYNFLSPDFTIQRNKIIKLLGDKFISLGDDKFKLIKVIEDFDPEIIFIEELSETFIDSNILPKLYNENRQYKILETTHNSHDSKNLKKFLPDKFIFVSEYSKEMYKDLGVKSTVIEYPVDKKIKSQVSAIKKLNLDPTSKHVVNIGLFTPGKNQGYAFELARQFQNKNVTFHFIGNQAGNFEDYWKPLMENIPSNCVVWGEKDNTDDFIMASDLFLFTSKLELNPLVVKEALMYDSKILMFNLETYCNSYNNENNISFLTGNIDNDVNKLINLLELDEINDNPLKRGYVLYSNVKYFNIVSEAAKSIRTFSELPIYVYMLDSDLIVNVKNTTTIKWVCNLENDSKMYQDSKTNFYINRCNLNIYKLLIQRPLIMKDVLTNYLDIAVYVDSDSIATSNVDNIFDLYTDLSYPFFVQGIYDYLFLNGRGGAKTKEDLTTTLEHPACELYNVNQNIRERYRQTGYFIASKECIDFMDEWYWMCINPTILKNNEHYAPYNEETILNVLLWKKGILNGLPYIYVNSSLDNIDLIYDKINLNSNEEEISEWVKVPASEENLLFFHGEKDIKIMSQMIDKLKNK